MASEIIRFLPTDSIIMSCHITGIYDVNRNITLEDDNYELVRNWAESIAALKLHGFIFHNNFTKETCRKYENEYITFIKIEYDPLFNPNVYRYFVYRDFLQQHANLIKSIFITDISDVVLVKNPFVEPYFIENPTAIFCGDEPKTLNNDWMRAHAAHLRKKILHYAEYENRFGKETLLNCGIIVVQYPFSIILFKSYVLFINSLITKTKPPLLATWVLSIIWQEHNLTAN